MNSLHEQIEAARKRVRYLKRVTPEIFPEWWAVKNAERRVDDARKELDAVRRIWKKLGSQS